MFKNINDERKIYDLSKIKRKEVIYLSPIFSSSGLIVRYPSPDIDKIKSLKLDMIVRGNATGIFTGGILKAAKEGIISFHHGDNRWNRGTPAGFWEVYLRKPLTGFIIQRLTEELDGGNVILRANIPTKRSYTENIINLYKMSYPYLERLIMQYAMKRQLPEQEEEVPYSGSLFQIPSIIQTIKYILQTIRLVLLLGMNKYILGKRDRWEVAFVRCSWHNAVLRKGTRIKAPPNRFFADPFVVTENGRSICFVEDYSYKKRKGCITAIELIDKTNYQILGPVIEENYHLSFPYIFTYHDRLYMIPETREANAIRLYRCIEFPLVWQYEKDILNGVNCVDTVVFFCKGKWWLVSNNNGIELVIYYSDNPISGHWISHEQNPLIIDSNISRNGGILGVSSQCPVRCRQKRDFNVYGASLTLARITQLSPSSFDEKEICQVLPDFFKNIKGCHHIHSNDIYTVYDYVTIMRLN